MPAKQIPQNVFECLRDKLARIYLDSTDGPSGRTHRRDACELLNGTTIKASSADLVITSPPYLKVVNYGTSNRIRLWWLGIDDVSRHGGAGRKTLDAKLDHRHTYESYKAFMLRTLKGTKRVLKRDGVAVFVIGDVATPGGPALDLAHRIWEDVGASTGLRLLESIEDSLPLQNKVSRIWGETKLRGRRPIETASLPCRRRKGSDPPARSRLSGMSHIRTVVLMQLTLAEGNIVSSHSKDLWSHWSVWRRIAAPLEVHHPGLDLTDGESVRKHVPLS
jgi:hypothetical protein